MRKKITLIFLFVFSLAVYGQILTAGLRIESYYYSAHNSINNTSEGLMMSMPFYSDYLTMGIEYYRFGLDLKCGIQLLPPFAGFEYGITVRYNIKKHLSPLIAYFRHKNGEDDHNSGGTYTEPINFIGAGAEAKLTKLFGLDLIFYLPVGNKNLEYSIGDNGERILSSKLNFVIKLGFIFNLIEFNGSS